MVRLRGGSYSVAYPETKDGTEYALVVLRSTPQTFHYLFTCLRCLTVNCADIEAVTRFRRQAGISEPKNNDKDADGS